MIYNSIVLLHSAFATCLPARGINGLVANFFPSLARKPVKWSEKNSDKAIFIWRGLAVPTNWTRRFLGFLPCQVPGYQSSFYTGLSKSFLLLDKFKGGRGLFLEARRKSSSFLLFFKQRLS